MHLFFYQVYSLWNPLKMKSMLLFFLFFTLSLFSAEITGKVIKIADGDTITILDSNNRKYKALFPIKVDLRSGKKGKNFEEIFSLLPRTPSSFLKPFCGIPIFAVQKSKCHLGVTIPNYVGNRVKMFCFVTAGNLNKLKPMLY